MTSRSPQARLSSLPLPLAQLGYRSLNAKSPQEAHHLAFFLAEATLRLCAITRAAIALEAGPVPDATHRALADLLLPSTGHWAVLAQVADAELGSRADAALLPLADALGGLATRRSWSAVLALAEECRTQSLASDERIKALRQHGVVAVFQFINEYRTQVVAHGAAREGAFYERLAPLWRAAGDELLGCDALWGEAWLAARVDEGAEGWLRLSGRSGLPAPLPNRERAERIVPVGGLGLIGTGWVVRLDPLLVYRRDEDLQTEQVGFFNGVELIPVGGSSEQQIGRLNYIDYSTGRTFHDLAGRERIARIVSSGLGPPRLLAPPSQLAAPYREPGAAVLDAPPRVGQSFRGLELVTELGRGRTEVVYRAVQPVVRRTVALKVLRPGPADDGLDRERFKRGLVALARCDHPNVVRVLTADLSGDPLHYTMEYVEGADLRRVAEILDRWRGAGTRLESGHLLAAVRQASDAGADGTPAPPRDVERGNFYHRLAGLFAGVTEGLAAVHDSHVLHRDIKPANIVFTHDGQRLVLIDFGVARLVDASQALSRSGGGLIGTLRYMSPEHLAGVSSDADVRADLYSLGATLYELATGRPVVEAGDEKQVRAWLAVRQPPRPRAVAPDLPRDLATIIERAIERDPADRYPSARFMAEDLAAMAGQAPLPHTRPRGLARLSWDHVRRHPLAAGLAGLSLLVAGGTWVATSVTNQIRVVHCVQPVEQNGVPTCLDGRASLPEGGGYRLEIRRGVVERMLHTDERGRLVAVREGADQGVATWEYARDAATGTVLMAIRRGPDGREIDRVMYNYRERDAEGRARQIDRLYFIHGVPRALPGTDIAGERLVPGAHGFTRVLWHLNSYAGVVRERGGGACGWRIQRASDGRELTRSPLTEEEDCR